jgi:hypothetical protein
MTDADCKKPKMSNALDQLKSMTTVVADTGDFEGKPANQPPTNLILLPPFFLATPASFPPALLPLYLFLCLRDKSRGLLFLSGPDNFSPPRGSYEAHTRLLSAITRSWIIFRLFAIKNFGFSARSFSH